MTKKALADQLRRRFKARVERDEEFRALVVSYGGDPDALAANIGSLSDDGAIDAYTTCAECGSKFWMGTDLQRIVEESRCRDDFLARCRTVEEGHACAFDWPTEIDAEVAEGGAAE
jgi:hypothetical protein